MAKELKDMSVPELCDVLRDHDDWDGGVSDKLRAKQNECESEIIRRIDEAKNTADQLRACLAGDDLEDVPVLAKGLLRAKMSEMSEDHYAASWLDGTGKVLWGMLRGEHREWGMQTVSDETLQLLCTLASESGGWWQDDETFVRLDEWQATHGEMTHVPLVSRINEAKARGNRLEAEVWAAREVGVAMKNIIKENRDKLHVDMSLALTLDKATDMWEKSALAVNAAGDLKEVENAK